MVVIGAGPAGEKAATQAAYFGKRVAVVERRPHPGGIAVSDAGIPTKTLRETAEYLTGFRRRDVYGIGIALDAQLKLQRMMSRTAELVDVMTDAVRGNLARMGVELVRGEARLGPGPAIRVKGPDAERVLQAPVILIATGSHPQHPLEVPFGDPGVSDSESILRLQSLPRQIAVAGAGAVGCEYASRSTTRAGSGSTPASRRACRASTPPARPTASSSWCSGVRTACCSASTSSATSPPS